MRIGNHGIRVRLSELEQALGQTIGLLLSDGSKVRLPARPLVSAVRDAAQHTMSPDVQMILAAVADDCPQHGQGHLADLNLIRVMALANSGAPVGTHPLDQCEGADGVSPEVMNGNKEVIQ
jgi:hypothetical protein